MTIRNQSVLTWLTRDFAKPHVLGALGEPNVDSYFFFHSPWIWKLLGVKFKWNFSIALDLSALDF